MPETRIRAAAFMMAAAMLMAGCGGGRMVMPPGSSAPPPVTMGPADLSAAAGGSASEVRLRANLTGDRLKGVAPGGHADFRREGTRRRLSVQIEDVRCPGVRLPALVDGQRVGAIRVNQLNRGDLNLDTADGEAVPVVQAGDRAVVRDNANGACTGTPGKVILSGTFRSV